jgi:hypothetical protein
MHRDRRNPKWIFFKVLFGIIFVAVISFILMTLWNWLLPSLFGIKTINYLHAIGLLILSKILFSGVGMRPHHHNSRHEEWHRKFKAEVDSQTNEMPKEK